MLDQKLDFERVKINTEEAQKRVKDFKMPVILAYTDEEGYDEAKRCLGCGLCIEGCPDRLDIPGYVKAIARHDNELAIKIIFRDLPLPLICGYICTHLCEDACVYVEPIAIRHLKRFAAEHVDYYEKAVNAIKAPDTGKKVAIVGAGPSGLSLAYFLTLYGVKCTIFEASAVPGGMLFLGIPKYRLPVEKIMKDVDFILSLGVDIKYNMNIGKDIKFEYLLENFDAVYIGGGTMKPRFTDTKGSDGKYFYHALDFLRKANLGENVEIGEKVAIIGGGFTAMDAARTAERLGAKKVVVMYRRRAIDRPGYGTSSAEEELNEVLEENVEFMWEVTPFEYVKENDKIVGIKYWKNKMVKEGKRASPVPIKDVEYFIEIDTIIEATGQIFDTALFSPEILKTVNIKNDEIVVDDIGQTSNPKIFAGGDAVNKTKDFITAVADGDKAVEGILKLLNIPYKKVIKPEWELVCSEINEAEHKNIEPSPYYK
jgi:NADPH-dependent glutamate synthase beta subunit-like oxidoreductase